MTCETTYKLEITHDEASVIRNLVELLDSWPVGLTDDDYVSIFRAISNGDRDMDEVDDLRIAYVEEE